MSDEGAGSDHRGRARLPAISLSYPGAVRTCDFCGRQERAEDDPAETLTWTTAVERGRDRTYCPTCSREHLRSMEGKLDSEWW